MANGVGAQGRADGALFQVLDRSWQRASAEHQCQVVRRFLTKISLDEARIVDAAVDHRRGVDAVLQNDGHLAVDVLLRKGAETLRAFR